MTSLKWERGAGASHDKSANGTLAILYVEGVYAEVTTAFFKAAGSQQVELSLKDGSVVRLGTWKRLEDSDLIRIESREVSAGDESKPLTARTCQLEHPSPVHIADGIVCKDLVLFYPHTTIGLGDFSSIVRRFSSGL